MSGPISVDVFADEARRFLDAHAERKRPHDDGADLVWGQGPEDIPLFEFHTPTDARVRLAAAATWRARKFDAGYGWITGPSEYGGRGLPSEFERRWRELEGEYVVPNQDVFGVGLGMVGPAIAAHGSRDAKDAYLRKLYRGEILGCQLFSEPAAGSDLAALGTRAERDGSDWIVNGQKVWTSHATLADIGLLLARSAPSKPKHKGITAFVIDMLAAGIEIRPLKQMNGNANFSEVFLTDVRISDRDRIGAVDDGWQTALTTLNNERASMGAHRDLSFLLWRLTAMIRHYGLADDRLVRQRLMQVVSGFRVADLSNQRAMAKVALGLGPGPELAMAKQAGIRNLRALVDLAAAVLGPRLIADSGEWGTWPWARVFLAVPGQRIGGGTDEVMKNVVAERVLGLPKEPAADAATPFDALLRPIAD